MNKEFKYDVFISYKRNDGIITMISQNVIRLGINWNIIKMLPEDKMPILDSLVNTYNILGYE